MKQIKWSKWSPFRGRICGGYETQETIMGWLRDLGTDAKRCVEENGKQHAIYGRKIYTEDDALEEIRLYVNTYVSDDELIEITRKNPRNVLYVAHRN